MPHIHTYVSEEEINNLRQIAADNNLIVRSGPGKGGGSIPQLLQTLGSGGYTWRLILKGRQEEPDWHERWIGKELADSGWDSEQWPLWAQRLYADIWDVKQALYALDMQVADAVRRHRLRLAFRRQRRRLQRVNERKPQTPVGLPQSPA